MSDGVWMGTSRSCVAVWKPAFSTTDWTQQSTCMSVLGRAGTSTAWRTQVWTWDKGAECTSRSGFQSSVREERTFHAASPAFLRKASRSSLSPAGLGKVCPVVLLRTYAHVPTANQTVVVKRLRKSHGRVAGVVIDLVVGSYQRGIAFVLRCLLLRLELLERRLYALRTAKRTREKSSRNVVRHHGVLVTLRVRAAENNRKESTESKLRLCRSKCPRSFLV